MKSRFSSLSFVAAGALAASVLSPAASQAVTVQVDPNQTWLAFMNVFEISAPSPTPRTQGGFVFASGWGFNDLTAEFDVPLDSAGSTLTLGPNTVGDPDPFWYIGGGAPGSPGNKWMDASGYVQVDDLFAGETVTFEYDVLSNSLTSAHTGVAFIRDFAPDFSTFTEVTAPLTAGAGSISLAADPGAGRHIQYGFNMQGENVWITDVDLFGAIVIDAIPEPTSALLIGLAGLGFLRRRR